MAHDFNLEDHLIDHDKWNEAPDIARFQADEGVPTAIGKHPTLGWYVIESSGQGPYLIWSEWEEQEKILDL